jgi:hypothetical protein
VLTSKQCPGEKMGANSRHVFGTSTDSTRKDRSEAYPKASITFYSHTFLSLVKAPKHISFYSTRSQRSDRHHEPRVDLTRRTICNQPCLVVRQTFGPCPTICTVVVAFLLLPGDVYVRHTDHKGSHQQHEEHCRNSACGSRSSSDTRIIPMSTLSSVTIQRIYLAWHTSRYLACLLAARQASRSS